jgi:ribosomal protein S14
MRTAWEKRAHGEAHDWPGHGKHHNDCRTCGAGFMGPRAFLLCRVCAPKPTLEASRGE